MRINKISKFICIFPFFFYTSIVLSLDISYKNSEERRIAEALQECDPTDKTDIFCQVMIRPTTGLTAEMHEFSDKIQGRMDEARPEIQGNLELQSRADKEHYKRGRNAEQRKNANQNDMKVVSEKYSQKIVNTMKNAHEYRKNPNVFVAKKVVKGTKKVYSSVKKRTKI